ncbi:Uncharacterized protein TPAR_02356 [Tolypocladium paradoxum]|uniref:Uncharacterized protein n=1 Tax=Tolypocladium paradoxum TaxID=94208 RepID=A0A2S4L4T7_9HYPO|nr:Uncharacterized protein TPAR_02356 [Tolypocladium paradoxum]
MVNFVYISLAIVATIIPLATAENCRDGFVYCGSSLMNKVGKYERRILKGLRYQKIPIDNRNIKDTLWRCWGNYGDIIFMSWCSSTCFDAGWDKNDYCPKGSFDIVRTGE